MNARSMYGLIWLVFLVIPLVLVWTLHPVALGWKILGSCGTVLFGVVYCWIAVSGQKPFNRDEPLQVRHVVAAAGLLLIPVCLTIPSLGVAVTSFAPYFASLGVFGLPAVADLYWSGFVLLLTVLVPLIFSPHSFFVSVTAPFLGTLCLTLVRFVEAREDAEHRMKNELDLVKEREAISRDVHDMLGHTLTVVSLKTQLALTTVHTDPERCESELTELMTLNKRALEDVRTTVGRLRTPDLATQVDEAENAMRAAGIHVTRHGDWAAWAPERRAVVAWAVREASTNVIRHAGATSCTLAFDDNGVTVTDNGNGLEGSREGHGLTGLRRRVEEAGGTVTLSDTGDGTELRVEFA
ncbi:two-component system sensor histidine kinase DesK [Brevibacterium paucivorans]|uniref:Two-component system sensor histidine kinase DesK n=1 Tax=Brevibacterium paucivorans TaxID=170994 RepID=A0ABS2SM25_9MICO|nr:MULTISPECIES: histidine kinase [Brevibacterium]MBM7817326.1 two-component system sensor histidine kinase DesK [Brevibacterium paucivorans]MCG7299553.1 histidine kinase [Brevibacterium sp. ACRRH]MDK7750154.1 histidine kinase [Brevibacterium sp. UMB10442]